MKLLDLFLRRNIRGDNRCLTTAMSLTTNLDLKSCGTLQHKHATPISSKVAITSPRPALAPVETTTFPNAYAILRTSSGG